MPRPKRQSDEAVLDAALQVILEKGPASFTLADVAIAVGLSRAALIQRFTDKATLHRKVMERMTQAVRDYFAGLSPETGLSPLWSMLKDLIAGMGGGGMAATKVIDGKAQLVLDDGSVLDEAAIRQRVGLPPATSPQASLSTPGDCCMGTAPAVEADGVLGLVLAAGALLGRAGG